MTADRYEGTLSDARGIVTGEVDGPHLRLQFTSMDGFRIEQLLTLSVDGRSVANRLTARRLGIVVATLDERIDKLD